MKRIVQLGHELGVETVRILFPVPMGGFLNASNEVLSLEEREKVRELNADPIVTMESPREGTRCTAAVTKLNILPDGRVTPCVLVHVLTEISETNPSRISGQRWSNSTRCGSPLATARFVMRNFEKDCSPA